MSLKTEFFSQPSSNLKTYARHSRVGGNLALRPEKYLVK